MLCDYVEKLEKEIEKRESDLALTLPDSLPARLEIYHINNKKRILAVAKERLSKLTRRI